jgi:hypothetical protein
MKSTRKIFYPSEFMNIISGLNYVYKHNSKEGIINGLNELTEDYPGQKAAISPSNFQM